MLSRLKNIDHEYRQNLLLQPPQCTGGFREKRHLRGGTVATLDVTSDPYSVAETSDLDEGDLSKFMNASILWESFSEEG